MTEKPEPVDVSREIVTVLIRSLKVVCEWQQWEGDDHDVQMLIRACRELTEKCENRHGITYARREPFFPPWFGPEGRPTPTDIQAGAAEVLQITLKFVEYSLSGTPHRHKAEMKLRRIVAEAEQWLRDV